VLKKKLDKVIDVAKVVNLHKALQCKTLRDSKSISIFKKKDSVQAESITPGRIAKEHINNHVAENIAKKSENKIIEECLEYNIDEDIDEHIDIGERCTIPRIRNNNNILEEHGDKKDYTHMKNKTPVHTKIERHDEINLDIAEEYEDSKGYIQTNFDYDSYFDPGIGSISYIGHSRSSITSKVQLMTHFKVSSKSPSSHRVNPKCEGDFNDSIIESDEDEMTTENIIKATMKPLSINPSLTKNSLTIQKLPLSKLRHMKGNYIKMPYNRLDKEKDLQEIDNISE